MTLQVPVDFLMLVLASVTAYYLRFSSWAVEMKPVLFTFSLDEFLAQATWVMLGWLMIFAISGLYRPHASRRLAQDVVRIFLACSAGLAGIAVYLLFAQAAFDSRFLVAAGWGIAVIYVVLGRLTMRGLKGLLYRAGFGLRKIAIIGSDDVARALKDSFTIRKELGYNVVGVYKSFTASIGKKILDKGVDEILVTNPRHNQEKSIELLEFANAHHIGFKYSADLFATLSANMSVHPVGGVPIVELKRTRLEGWGRIVKRLLDIAGSALLMLLLLPVYVLFALLIMIESGCPVIYRNERVGIRGKHFMTLKFRSMFTKDCTGSQFGKAGAAALKKEEALIKKQNSKSGPIYKVADDPRITKVGHFIRRWSIDEIPQFWNVFKGEMSLVGPRPHQPREVAGYDREHNIVFSIKPGISGLAQISGRSDLSFEEEMRLDALYIERWSLWLDLIILIKTPFVLLKRRNVV